MPNPFYMSFPGLGIEPFQVNKIAFTLFGREVAWYGVIICIGLLLAFGYGCLTTKKEKISMDDYLNMMLLLIPFGILGARLYHVLMELDYYKGRPFVEWIAIWNGGGAINGTIIAGILVTVCYCLAKKIKITRALDAFAPALLIGQFIGRWGNFVNGEAFGSETAVAWRMGLGFTENIEHFYHPTFLYESLWNVALFLIIHFLLYRKKHYDGEIILFYVAFYGAGRFLVEQFRIDNSPIVFGMRIAGLVGLLCFVLFGALFVLGFVKAAKKEENAPALAEGEELSDEIPAEPEETTTETNNTNESENEHDPA